MKEKTLKVLYCASNDIHIKNFHLPYLKFFKESGFEVHLVSRGGMSFPYVDVKYDISFEKNILSTKNMRALSAVKDILEQNRYDIISIHTALAGAIVRLAVIFAGKRNARVIYTSHGYFFWNSAPFSNWIKYLSVEKLCAVVTDSVMAMNQEDLELAKKYKLCTGVVEKISGMGVDLSRFKPGDGIIMQGLRRSYGIRDDDFVIVYPAEMSRRKNHRDLLQAFAEFLKHVPSGCLFLPGEGLLLEENKALVKELGIVDRVIFPGYIDGMEEIYPMCDIAASSAISEGLPLNIIEAMACGLPIVASRIRGHVDLVEEEINGFLYTPGDRDELGRALRNIYGWKERLKIISTKNVEKVKQFDLEQAESQIYDIYKKYM